MVGDIPSRLASWVRLHARQGAPVQDRKVSRRGLGRATPQDILTGEVPLAVLVEVVFGTRGEDPGRHVTRAPRGRGIPGREHGGSASGDTRLDEPDRLPLGPGE